MGIERESICPATYILTYMYLVLWLEYILHTHRVHAMYSSSVCIRFLSPYATDRVSKDRF